MKSFVATIASLMLSTAILLVGHGLQLTLVPLRGASLGWTADLIGYTGSAYFAGFVAGCFLIPRFVARVGHVRVFMVLTATATASLLALGLSEAFLAWLISRALTGGALAGLYLVIESWLNEQSPTSRRGTVLAVYSGLVLLSMVAGQQLLGRMSPDSFEPVALGAILLAIAAVPVGLSRSRGPTSVAEARFSVRRLYNISHVAIGVTFFTGMTQGTIFSLAPVLGASNGFGVGTIASMMSAFVLGGAALQLPLGRLSDRVDRRLVILGVLVAACIVALGGWWFATTGVSALLVVMFLTGGSVLTLYPLCLAHANDNSTQSFLEVGTGILMVNSIGAALGPLVCAWSMGQFGPNAFFLVTFATLAAATAWTAVFIGQRAAKKDHLVPYANPSRTSPAALALDPRNAGGLQTDSDGEVDPRHATGTSGAEGAETSQTDERPPDSPSP